MKKYIEEWNEDEIDDYLEEFGILVLFNIHESIREAEVIIHGDMSSSMKDSIKVAIIAKFGGQKITHELCSKINSLAEKWYNKFISRKPMYVLNFVKKK